MDGMVWNVMIGIGGRAANVSTLQDSLIRSASRGGSDNVNRVRMLLQQGVYVNCVDYNLRTPLHHAVTNGDVEMVYLLLEHKVRSYYCIFR
jgi:ankyrin repeat protein